MFVDELDKYFADVGLYILTVGWIKPFDHHSTQNYGPF